MKAIKRIKYGEKERIQLQKMVDATKQAEDEESTSTAPAGIRLIAMDSINDSIKSSADG